MTMVPVGRVSFFADGEIVVLPVNHVMDGQDPVFRTERGSRSAAQGQNVVAFQVDRYDGKPTQGGMERPGQRARPRSPTTRRRSSA